jgi:hypothetical protein
MSALVIEDTSLLFFVAINVWLILWYLAWGIAALYTIMTISIWTATIQTLGVSSLRHCLRVLRLSFRASAIRELFIAILMPLVVVIIGNVYEPAAWYVERLPVNAFLLMGVLCFTLFFVPPTVLVFSTSTDERLRWALALKGFTGGRRVISLLDTGYIAVKPGITDVWAIMSRRAIVLTDVLRTSEAGNWQEVVKELIELTPIVVVDTRIYTRALQFEAATMLMPKYADKAIFVCEDDGRCPVLEQVLAESSIRPDLPINVVKEDELGQVLRNLVTSKNHLRRPLTFASTPYMLRTPVESRVAKTVPSVAPVQSVDSIYPNKRLSMAATPVVRFLAKVSLVHIAVSLILGALVISRDSDMARLGLSRTTWLLMVVSSCACGALYYHLAHALKDISIVGDQLLVSQPAKQSKIPLSQITHVTGPDWTTMRRITLHLSQPCVFGKRIVFAAGPLKGGMVARDLRRRVYSQAPRTSRV